MPDDIGSDIFVIVAILWLIVVAGEWWKYATSRPMLNYLIDSFLIDVGFLFTLGWVLIDSPKDTGSHVALGLLGVGSVATTVLTALVYRRQRRNRKTKKEGEL